jgi:hypothetical protein
LEIKRGGFMKRLKPLIILTIILTSFTLTYADCPPGTNWTAVYTDNAAETTYTITAPCKVYVNEAFDITATVTDNANPNAYVAFKWGIFDNGTLLAGTQRFNWLKVTNGQWQTTYVQKYSELIENHLIEFRFTDLGEGMSPHDWGLGLIGDITVDPYPPSSNNPPEVSAGSDILLESQDQSITTIYGRASDIDGDLMTYRWLADDIEIQGPIIVDSSGNIPLPLGILSPLTLGAHIFTLEISDGKDIATDDVRVCIENSPPTVATVGGGTFQIWSDIYLNASVSDYDGDTLNYIWRAEDTILASGTIQSNSGGSPISLPENLIIGGLPLGVHTLTLVVSDGIHTMSSDISIAVIDSVAPTLAPVTDTLILWPPDNKMVDVVIYANSEDNSRGQVTLTLMVNNNELPAKNDKDKAISDYSIQQINQQNGVIYLQLRAARTGNQVERIYTVSVTATDGSGNSSFADVLIKVPHDISIKKKHK